MLNDKVTRIAFAISFIGHCLFLGMPGFNFSLPQDTSKPEEITVRIEIERPSLLPEIDVMREEKKLKKMTKESLPPESEFPSEEKITMEQPLEEQVKERIEVINPDQEAMLRYQDMIKQRIEEARRYPSWAKRQGVEGAVYLRFTVSSDGLSQNVRVMRSSGSAILDQEAIATIVRAEPFPPIPDDIKMNSVQIDIAIVFTLKSDTRSTSEVEQLPPG